MITISETKAAITNLLVYKSRLNEAELRVVELKKQVDFLEKDLAKNLLESFPGRVVVMNGDRYYCNSKQGDKPKLTIEQCGEIVIGNIG